MIFPASVTNALFTQLASDSVLVNSGYRVAREEDFNTDPARLPWVGVYLDRVLFTPYRSNTLSPYLVDYFLTVLVQEGSLQSGERAHERLQLALNPVVTAIYSDRTLGGTVLGIVRMEIVPLERGMGQDNWLFTDQLNIQAQVLP